MRRLIPFLVLFAACTKPSTSSSSALPPVPVAPKPIDAQGISGPYVHENLTVFLVHAPSTDERDYLTLDEGLTSKEVTISEKADAQVNQLVLENKSGRPLFLQEGDRLQGGKQDRIIGTSLVIPPKSGEVPVPSFCIESGRWAVSGAVNGKVFAPPANFSCASNSVRKSAKLDKDQGKVWRGVAREKVMAAESLTASNSNSSLNETMDSVEVRKACEGYEKALGRILEDRADAIGVVFAVNGRIEEAGVYPNRKLFARMYPRLLASYAMVAALEKPKEAVPAIASTDVAAFMKEGAEGRTEKIDGRNVLTIGEFEKKFACATAYEGRWVHRQWFRK